MSLLATCIFVTLVTLTWGQQPPCYDLLVGESYEVTNTHPDTDIWAHGTMNASLVLPVTNGTQKWKVVIKFSRVIDELHVSMVQWWSTLCFISMDLLLSTVSSYIFFPSSLSLEWSVSCFLIPAHSMAWWDFLKCWLYDNRCEIFKLYNLLLYHSMYRLR